MTRAPSIAKLPASLLAATAATAVVLAAASGCATVVHGTTQRIDITSNPPGATATVLPDGNTVTTPAQVELARGKVHTVLFRLDGFEPATVYVNKRVSAVTGGNLILGGVIGAAKDAENGAAWELVPNPVHAQMTPVRPVQ